MDTNIGQFMGHKNNTLRDNDVLEIKDIRRRSLQVFENKEYFNLAILKTERLASALYLVSNLISDNEPLKWTLRKNGTDMVSDISLMGVGSSDKGHKVSLEKIMAKIFEITSLLQVAWMGGLISNMNFEILRSEYFKLGEFLKEKFYSTTPDSLLVSEDFFLSDELKNKEDDAGKILENRKISEQNFFKNLNSPLRDSLSSSRAERANPDSSVRDISCKGQLTSGTVLEKKMNVSSDINFTNVSSFVKNTISDKMSDRNKKKRHDLICSLLKPGQNYTVPEILNLIGMGEALSEKTIQRDLIQLVSNNSLKKTGERRWSRYSLI